MKIWFDTYWPYFMAAGGAFIGALAAINHFLDIRSKRAKARKQERDEGLIQIATPDEIERGKPMTMSRQNAAMLAVSVVVIAFATIWPIVADRVQHLAAPADAPIGAGEMWLKLLDTGDYPRALQAITLPPGSNLSAAHLEEYVSSERRGLGALLSRSLAESSKPSDDQPQRSRTLIFRSKFERGELTERVTVVWDERKGEWGVRTYFAFPASSN